MPPSSTRTATTPRPTCSQLKGIHGGAALYRVEAVPAGRVAHLRRRLAARRGPTVAIVLAVLVLCVVAVGAWAA